jgi:mortality factor 4-like protein 1
LADDPDGFQVYKELFEGLCMFFDKALPNILLYRHERHQFNVISEKIKEENDVMAPSSVYGSEHLLRLFSRLPKLLSHLFIPTSEMNQVTNKITEFLKWFSAGKKSEHNDKKINPKYIEIEEYVLAEEALKLKENLSLSGRKVRKSKKQLGDDYVEDF